MELKHINSGSLVWAEIEEKTVMGKKIQKLGFNDVELVDDNVITELVKNSLRRFDVLVPSEGPKNQLKGWIMDGFPRTFNQAQLMQVSGFLPDKVIVLTESPEICKEVLTKRFIKLQNVSEDDARKMADVKYRNFMLHLNKIKVAFKDIMMEIDTTDCTKQEIYQRVKVVLEIKPRDKIAYRSPSIAILGPPCSNKKQIEEHFVRK